MLKLRTQIDNIIIDTLKTDSEGTQPQPRPELRERITEELKATTPSSTSVKKPNFTESLDQDRSSIGRSSQPITIIEYKHNVQTQTSIK